MFNAEIKGAERQRAAALMGSSQNLFQNVTLRIVPEPCCAATISRLTD